jgi:hypothetical protein
MGQGYRPIILASQKHKGKEVIRTWVDSHTYGNGYKLTEHSYIGNNFVEAVEYLISPLGMFHRSRLIWSGDYADNEEGFDENLYFISDNHINKDKMSAPSPYDMSSYRYIVNHTQEMYIDKNTMSTSNIHPLPLLTAEGNGRGGGDYHGDNQDLVGTWARDTISVEKEIPDGYDQLVCGFTG